MECGHDHPWLDEHGNEIEESDRGLVYDLRTLVDRRRMLGLFGGVGAAALLAACGGGTTGASSSGTTAATTGTTTGATSGSGDLTEVPEETAGPLPGGRLQRPQRAG
jgi:hypothetical protein